MRQLVEKRAFLTFCREPATLKTWMWDHDTFLSSLYINPSFNFDFGYIQLPRTKLLNFSWILYVLELCRKLGGKAASSAQDSFFKRAESIVTAALRAWIAVVEEEADRERQGWRSTSRQCTIPYRMMQSPESTVTRGITSTSSHSTTMTMEHTKRHSSTGEFARWYTGKTLSVHNSY